MADLFLETTCFQNLGGWVIDSQCVEAMGSAYLMAHGIGKPVADAETIVNAEDGDYTVWAYTRDWTAVWKRGTPAGRFQIVINGIPMPEVMGTNSSEWAWAKAGSVYLKNGKNSIALHDLTGFNGRCAALFLSDNASANPAFSEPPVEDDPEFYDLIVCGGGFAGTCTAISAERKKLKTLLIQDRNVLGGCGSSEVRVWVGGMTNVGKYPNIGNIADVISPITGIPGMMKTKELFEDDRKRLLLNPETIRFNEQVRSIERDAVGNISAIITKNLRSGKRTRRRAALFSDCTGDALLARLAGCSTMYGREARAEFNESLAPEKADNLVMGHSVLWEINKCDHEVKFPDIDWGIEFNDENAIRRFNCCWDWECGQFRDQIMDIEYIRDYGLMTVMANWSFLKNHAKDNDGWKNLELDWVSPIGGKRESCRIKGDLILSQNDIENNVEYPDASLPMTWSIDLHLPDPKNWSTFEEGFLSCAYHREIGGVYNMPYRCLYAAEVGNLFLGGRCISATHVAFSSIRVMRTLGMAGEVQAMAAAICRQHNCTPRQVYEKYLQELCSSMQEGIWKWRPHSYMPSTRRESWHYMRPVGTCNNPSSENVWVMLQNGKPADGTAPEIRKCIEWYQSGDFSRETLAESQQK